MRSLQALRIPVLLALASGSLRRPQGGPRRTTTSSRSSRTGDRSRSRSSPAAFRLHAGGDGSAASRPGGLPQAAAAIDSAGWPARRRSTTSRAIRDERARLRSPRPAALGEKSCLLRDGGRRRERSAGAEGPFAYGTVELFRWRFPPQGNPGRRARARLAQSSVAAASARQPDRERARPVEAGNPRPGTAAERPRAAARPGRSASRARGSGRAGAGSDRRARPLAEGAGRVEGGPRRGDRELRLVPRERAAAPYTWAGELTLAQRELARATAALALEEHRNRGLPPQAPVASAEEHQRRFSDGVTEYMAFLASATSSPSSRTWTLRCERGSGSTRRPAARVLHRGGLPRPGADAHPRLPLVRSGTDAAPPHPSPIRRGRCSTTSSTAAPRGLRSPSPMSSIARARWDQPAASELVMNRRSVKVAAERHVAAPAIDCRTRASPARSIVPYPGCWNTRCLLEPTVWPIQPVASPGRELLRRIAVDLLDRPLLRATEIADGAAASRRASM